ncbi:MAG: hypothetical protein HY721_08565 [Planctomycetes bacterium]|nr:hypothetical protein [Planctomycetota bacterium]
MKIERWVQLSEVVALIGEPDDPLDGAVSGGLRHNDLLAWLQRRLDSALWRARAAWSPEGDAFLEIRAPGVLLRLLSRLGWKLGGVARVEVAAEDGAARPHAAWLS